MAFLNITVANEMRPLALVRVDTEDAEAEPINLGADGQGYIILERSA